MVIDMASDKRDWGLVLGGGGAKGSYEIGVWKALRELGFEGQITAVSGASVGALNAALFAAGDLERAQKIWENITHVQFLEINHAELEAQFLDKAADMAKELLETVKRSGICSREGLLDIMKNQVDLSAVSMSGRRIYADCAYEFRGGMRVDYIALNGLKETDIMAYLLASSAMPYVYEPVNIKGIFYRDGGMADNIPVYPLARDGMERLIVVKLDKDGYVEKNFYRNREVIEIVPSRDLGDFFDGTVDFSHNNIMKRMELGYQDALFTLRSYQRQKQLEATGESVPAGKTRLYTLDYGVSGGNNASDVLSIQAEHMANIRALQKRMQYNMDYIRGLDQ